jgi:PKD repeat protein
MRSIPLIGVSTVLLAAAWACGGDGGGVQPPTPPVAAFTAPTTCTPGTPCQFTDASTDPDGTIASRSWDFGDPTSGAANTSADQNPTHTFATANTYQVKLTVTDNDAATGTVTNPVKVGDAGGNQNPVASFDLPTGCSAGTPCGFHSTSTDPDVGGTIAASHWDFGDPSSDNNTADTPDATHTFANAGTYTVTLTVTDDKGAQSTPATQQLIVSPAASQSCNTSSGTLVDCTLTMTQKVTVKIIFDHEDCQLSGNKLTVNFPSEGEQTAFFNLCNRTAGEEYIVKDATGAAARVFLAGSTLPLRFHQGVKGPNDPPTGDPGIRITGSFPNWTLNVDDGGAAGTEGEPDFNDVVMRVQATTAP